MGSMHVLGLSAALAAMPAALAAPTTTVHVDNTHNNIAIDGGALQKNAAGLGDIAIGNRVLEYNTGGSYNTVVGTQALPFVQGDYNIALGYQAGFFLQRGSNNILIGNIGNPYG